MATKKDDKPKRDFRQDLTNQIVELIEQGAAPWQKPWNPDAASSFLEMPYNATSGRAYRGGNALYLMAKAQLMGSDDPRWCTFKQAQAKGWQVKKGSKGTSVEYWQFDKEEERFDPTTGKKEKVTVKLENPRVFYATVFHASQIEGIPEYKRRERPDGWDPVEEADRILTGSGARIFHDQQDRAYYSPDADEIHLPPREAFPQPLDYYEVAMHELGHWTGHEKRLNRDLSGGFGSESYAREELRAQMASLYLSAELGVPFNPERHAAYQASWVKALKEDKHEIFRAARDAEIMADYVIDLARERTIEQAQERTAEERTADAPADTVGDKNAKAIMQNIDKALDKIDALIDMHRTRTPVAELTTMPGVALTVNDRKELIATLPNNQEIMFGGTPAFIQWAEENKLTRAERDAGYQALGAIARDNRDTDRSLAAYMAKTPEMLGEGGKLYSPRPDVARQYDGKFIYMNENYAVQQIGKDTAIVHDLEKIGRGEALERIANSIETGKALRMAYEPGRDAPALADAPSLENRDRLSRGYQEVKQAVAAALGAEAKTYIPNRNAQEYRGSVIFVNETHVVQQVGKATAIAHLRENFDEVPEIGGQMRVSYKDGRMTQRTTPGQEAELQSLKTEHMGKDAKLQFAYDNEGRQTFDGPIVAETGSYVIQKVNDQTAIVHAKTNLQKDVEVGHNLSIVYEHGKVYAEELSADKQREHAKHDAQEKGHTAKSAREQVREKFGKDAKIVDAKFVDAEQGNFTGTVVAQDDDRVIQRIGANKFIAHERSALDGGDVGIGQFVKVQYNQGKAIMQGAQRQQQQDRQRGPDREIAR